MLATDARLILIVDADESDQHQTYTLNSLICEQQFEIVFDLTFNLSRQERFYFDGGFNIGMPFICFGFGDLIFHCIQ